jgi:hypothetical protein
VYFYRVFIEVLGQWLPVGARGVPVVGSGVVGRPDAMKLSNAHHKHALLRPQLRPSSLYQQPLITANYYYHETTFH